jgi:predicted Fe-Mo cluster-binding NifX family protein
MTSLFRQRFIAYLSALCLSFFSLNSLAESPSTLMAVAAQGDTAQSMISHNLEQTSHFLLFDREGHFLRAFAKQASHSQSLRLLNRNQVTVLVMGEFSATLLEKISQYGIIPMRRTGSATAAVVSLLQCDPEETKKKSTK